MNENYRGRYVNMFLALLDITLVYVGYAATIWFYHVFSIPIKGPILDEVWLIVLSAPAFLCFYLIDLYKDWRRKSIHNLIYSVVLSMIVFSSFISIVSIWTPLLSFRKSFIIESFLIQTILLIGVRVGIWYVGKKLSGNKRVIIICEDEKMGLTLADKFLNHEKGWFEISGFLTLSNLVYLQEYVNKYDIFLLSPTISGQKKDDIVSICIKYGKEVFVVPQLSELFVQSSEAQQIDDMLVLSIKPPKFSRWHQIIKRMFDVIVSLILIIISSPFCLILFLLIPLTSKGPALYKQERIGLHGKTYWIYKFRSMIQNAENRTGPVLAINGDTRITLIGKIIRATRFDELPQLFNVIKGEMSLVGPRPEREYFINQFKEKLPDYTFRLTVKPGITGLAQVLANYSTTVEDKLRFDLLYVRSYSFSLDLKILFQTLRVVIQRDQAQGVKEKSKTREQKLINKLEQNKVINH